ncbi:dehydroquinate dehydratase [Chloropicon primus]|uniref:shikimate dehydrogenase (NADP(+)) n=2 Tax=Chloropicon primus TaxID=1764295 RepID=A0A5B8MQA7_9CHLO|nr:dehydroquinate dehydratase [Chloropicon primus]UPR01762.1 dehydroquinate dehydratase [Chloropicon primus]|eukprot:QDZ22541.1 dehydroquinate dehydratase [Chloropicon primus]
MRARGGACLGHRGATREGWGQGRGLGQASALIMRGGRSGRGLRSGERLSWRPRAIGKEEAADCMLCTSITAEDMEGSLKQIEAAMCVGVDIVELRLDYLKAEELDVEGLVGACRERNLRCIATYRPEWEGGRYAGGEEERLSALVEAAKAGANYVDLEYKLGEERLLGLRSEVSQVSGCKVIVSDHNYEVTPSSSELRGLIGSMKSCGADVTKIATTATCTKDAFRMLQLAREESGEGNQTIALAMGEMGLPSRLLAPKYGAFLTFGALTAGRESAPGQPSLADMMQVYRLKSQRSDTEVFGVIGDPIKHSMSPVIHNAAFDSVGSNAVYLPFLVTDVEDFITTFKEYDLSGCSITIPHKEQVEKYCGEVDQVASKIGAINTIVSQREANGEGEATLKASNTDWVAAISAIEEGMGGPGSLKGKEVCILGSGGTARALAFGALERGAGQVTIANRTLSKAETLAKELGCLAKSLEDLEGDKSITGSVLINTTSVGMSGPNVDKAPVSAGVVARFDLVFDAIYNPLKTKLLGMAEEGGKTTVSGVEMFIGQAAEQFKQFTGAEPPLDLMREKVMERL